MTAVLLAAKQHIWAQFMPRMLMAYTEMGKIRNFSHTSML